MKRKVNKLYRFLSNIRPSRHIMVKIWLSTAAVVLAFIVLIMLGAQFFFNHFYLDSALERTAANAQSIAEAASSSLDSIILRFVSVCGTTRFREMLFRIRSADKTDYTELNNDLQDTIYNLSTCDSLVVSAVITSKQNLLYSLLSQQLTSTATGYTLGYAPEDIRGLSFLPIRESPVRGKGPVMTLAIPLAFLGGDSLMTIAPDAVSSIAILFLFLDAESFNNTLAQYGDSKYDAIYMRNGAGTVLNTAASDHTLDQVMQPGIFGLPSVGGDGQDTTQIHQFGDQWVLRTRVGRRDIFLNAVISKETLLSPLTKLETNLLVASAGSVLIVILVTLFSAFFLSAPLRKLTGTVKAISSGTYTSDSKLRQRDEIGQLSEAIDTMYNTIQSQIRQIYEERRAKYNAEVRLFTEQINPHFLYNTLEFINLEVYNGHTENAALMIQSLGSFMRIGLSFGREKITLGKELQHVQAYLTILNHRFSHNICFTADIPQEIQMRYVPKIILQPFVENAIRHGFLLEDSSSFIENPTIRIQCQREGEMLVLSIIDNGVGFDAEKTTTIMHSSSASQSHLGLNNVFARLRLYYGEETDITFQSIPYYRNTVSIYIPYCHTAAADSGQMAEEDGKPPEEDSRQGESL